MGFTKMEARQCHECETLTMVAYNAMTNVAEQMALLATRAYERGDGKDENHKAYKHAQRCSELIFRLTNLSKELREITEDIKTVSL